MSLRSDPFTLGVASGDPDSTSVVLWARLAPEPFAPDGGMTEPVTSITVEVAPDASFTTDVRSERFPVDSERGHSVHAVVEGLEPATTYAYRFRLGPFTSRIGRTRTAPAPGTSPTVRLAVAACQRYGEGFYVAHRDMAAADLDLVVWVGDYIYPIHQGDVRPAPDGAPAEVVDLEGYRHRYAAARLDPDLAANHAAHPWVLTWDDHEVRNNYAGAAGDVPPGRLAAAYQAWWEHGPVRVAPPDGPSVVIHRAVRLGDTVDVLLLDDRQYRGAEAGGGGVIDDDDPELGDPDRSMLGADQEQWLNEALADSSARWTALAQAVVMARIDVLGHENADAWDGYPVARDRLLRSLAAVPNPVVLTGDVHIQVVADVTDGDGSVVAVELITPSVSSLPNPTYRDGVPLLRVRADTVQHAADVRGWLRCEVDATTWTATYREVADATDAASAVADGPSFRITAGTPGAHTAPRSDLDDAPGGGLGPTATGQGLPP